MFNQFGYSTPSYMGTNYQNPYNFQRQNVTPQMQQYQTQPQAQPQMQQPIPQIQDIRYGTEEEAKAFIVFPNAIAYFIDEQKGRLYAKTANNAGVSSINYFAITPINSDGTPVKPQEPQPQIDMGEYIKKSDLAQLNLVTMEQLNDILSKLTTQQNKPMGVKPNATGNTKPTQM